MAVLVASAALVAVIVTGITLAIVAGALYRPELLIVPAPVAGDIDQVTPVFEVPWTVAVNCCVAPGPSVTVAGVKDTLTDGFTEITPSTPVTGSELPSVRADLTLLNCTARFPDAEDAKVILTFTMLPNGIAWFPPARTQVFPEHVRIFPAA